MEHTEANTLSEGELLPARMMMIMLTSELTTRRGKEASTAPPGFSRWNRCRSTRAHLPSLDASSPGAPCATDTARTSGLGVLSQGLTHGRVPFLFPSPLLDMLSQSECLLQSSPQKINYITNKEITSSHYPCKTEKNKMQGAQSVATALSCNRPVSPGTPAPLSVTAS